MRAKALIFLFVFISMTMIHLWLNSYIISAGYKSNELAKELSEIRGKNRQLMAEIASASHLGKIEARAHSQLNMVYPEKVNFIIVSAEAQKK